MIKVKILPGICGELLSRYIDIIPLTVSTRASSVTREVPRLKIEESLSQCDQIVLPLKIKILYTFINFKFHSVIRGCTSSYRQFSLAISVNV